jgi:beta-lactam-binding protein with PASTA domain
MICAVGLRHRAVLASCGVLAAACALAACGNSPAPRAAPTTSSSTTTSSTTTTTTTTLPPSVAVPNVVGMKIDLARFYLWTAGFVTVPLTPPCNKGTPISQSVVASLSVPGRPPDVTVGAQTLVAGTLLDKGALVGITWSGCYPAGTEVPQVVGHTFANAVRLLHLAGLNWACFSVGGPTTTTTTRSARTTTSSTTTTTPAPQAVATAAAQPVVITQGTKDGTLVQAGTVVDILMHHCPQ